MNQLKIHVFIIWSLFKFKKDYLSKFYVLLRVHLHIIVKRKTNLMHNLFLMYFVNLYMFRVYLGLSSGGTAVCIQHWVLIIFLVDCLLSWCNQEERQSTKKTISTNCFIHTAVPPDDRPRYARNIYRLTKYIKNKLFIKLVFLFTLP
jgi:hypothetical protein